MTFNPAVTLKKEQEVQAWRLLVVQALQPVY